MDDIKIIWISLNGVLIIYTIIMCFCARRKKLKERVFKEIFKSNINYLDDFRRKIQCFFSGKYLKK